MTRAPHSKQSSMIESLFFINLYGLTTESPVFGQPLLTYLITLDMIVSLQDQARIRSCSCDRSVLKLFGQQN